MSKRTINKIKKLAKESYVIIDFAYYRLIQEGGNSTEKPLCNAVKKVITTMIISFYPAFTKKLKKFL